MGYVDPLLVIPDQTPPSDHPAEGAFDDASAWQDREALLVVGAADDLDDEVEIAGLVHEFEPVIGAVREEVLDPGPALADALEDRHRARTVGDVGAGEVDHQQSPVGIDRVMPLVPDDLLAGIVTPCFCMRGLHRLAVDDTRARVLFAPLPLPVEHQFKVMYSLEQEPPRQFAEPAIDRLPGSEVDRQHTPPAARAHKVTHRVDHLPE